MPTYQELVKKYQKRRKDTLMDSVAAGLSYADNVAVQLGLLEDSALIEFCDKMQNLRDEIDELGEEIEAVREEYEQKAAERSEDRIR